MAPHRCPSSAETLPAHVSASAGGQSPRPQSAKPGASAFPGGSAVGTQVTPHPECSLLLLPFPSGRQKQRPLTPAPETEETHVAAREGWSSVQGQAGVARWELGGLCPESPGLLHPPGPQPAPCVPVLLLTVAQPLPHGPGPSTPWQSWGGSHRQRLGSRGSPTAGQSPGGPPSPCPHQAL